jgi:hypothetical protein
MEYPVEQFIGNIRKELAGRAAMAACYASSWGDRFVREQIQEVWNDTGRGLRTPTFRKITPNELQSMLPEDLRELGFGLWSDDEPLYLIPLYIYNYLDDGIELKSISGDTKVKGIDEIDLDVRMGCIAWGFVKS